MYFTPKYNVVYRGVFHQGGKAFDIAAEDAEKMRKHGTVEVTVSEQTDPEQHTEYPEKADTQEPPAPAEKYTCPHCGKEYKSEESLDKHIKGKHPEVAEPKEQPEGTA